jgi:serine phosphatase RsbU (regulator of sigma subunit)
MPIGYYPEPVPFEYTEIDLSAGDTIYLFSDGYADQFGGPLGKKFKYKALKDLLTSVGWQPMVQQCISVEKSWTDWKGEHEQVDDIILIAIRFSEQTFEGKQLG